MSAKEKTKKTGRSKRATTTRTSRQPAKLSARKPSLQFSPTAWAKLLFLRDYGETEVGGFGICPNDPLLVEDIVLIKQQCTYVTVVFDDDSVANFFDEQVDQGLRPDQFARIWIHTHPGDCPNPSCTDEQTFSRVFSHSEWAVMFILACGGESYARLRFNVGPQADLQLPVGVDFTLPFAGSNAEDWQDEYLLNVKAAEDFQKRVERRITWPDDLSEDLDDSYELMHYQLLEEGEESAHGYY